MIAYPHWPPEAAAGIIGLLQLSAKTALILAAAALASFALRRSPAAARHLVWAFALAAILCLPLLSLALPSWHVEGFPQWDVARVYSRPAAADTMGSAPGSASASISPGGLALSEAPPLVSARTAQPAARPAPSSRRPGTHTGLSDRLPALALLVWLLGASIGFAYMLLCLLSVRRAVRRARPLTDASWQETLRAVCGRLHLRRRVTLLSSCHEHIPMVWGWRHPVLLLPSNAHGWPAERRRLVLLHELAHVRRADCLTQMLGDFARAVYWFQPLVWLAVRHLRREREQACDDVVLRSGFRASDYAAHLLDIAGRPQSSRVAHTAAAAMATPVGLERRIRSLLDTRRTRHAVARRRALAATLAATAMLFALASVQGAGMPLGHSPGARAQWQPQFDRDARLDERVQIEIVGRAAVPALALLSDATGVSLAVAPENMSTLGERKLTVVAQECSLRGLMVQLPNALHECHWDIDQTGSAPSYLLHLNSGAELTMEALGEDARADFSWPGRAARQARVEAARRALTMSPEELARLAESEPLLAGAVQDPEARKWMELFFSLPAEQMDLFVAKGQFELEKASVSAPLRQAVGEHVQAGFDEATRQEDPGLAGELYTVIRDNLAEVGLRYEDWGADLGIALRIYAYDRDGERYSCHASPIPPKLPWRATPEYRQLLLSSGVPDGAAADKLLAELVRKHEEEAAARHEREEQEREAELRPPPCQELHRTVTLPFPADEDVDPIEVQQFIARETGLSLISDYYTAWAGRQIPEEAQGEMPIWRLLHLLKDHWYWRYEWDETGNCLVFRNPHWYRDVPRELPESVIDNCRETLAQHGRLTLDDVAGVAAALWPRTQKLRTPPGSGANVLYVPSDLRQAGLGPSALLSGTLVLYHDLSQEQREQARSASGLSYYDLSGSQRALVQAQATKVARPVPEDELPQAILRHAQSPGTEGPRPRERHDLVLAFPNRVITTAIFLAPPRGRR